MKKIVKKIILFLIKTYQYFLSPILILLGLKNQNSCVFYPTCSSYAISAVNKYGAIKGSWLSLKRIMRCHPWQKNNFDPLR